MIRKLVSTDRKPSLLFVGSFPQPGGKVFGGNVTDCAALLDAGLAEHFELTLVDTTQRTVPPPPVWKRFCYFLPRAWKFLRLLMRESPDAVLLFASSGLSFFEKSLLAYLSRLFGSRVLIAPRGGRLIDDCRRSPVYRRLVQTLLRTPHVVLCQGEAWREFFVQEMQLPPERCEVLRSWTATPALLELGADRSYSAERTPRILFLGWLDRDKGVFELIDAVAQLRRRYPHLQLQLAGEGKASAEAREYASQQGCQEMVQFLGWVQDDRKQKALSDATVFCLPSYVEGLPNAMIEAMAAGLPVIVTPVGSIPDVISNRENGLLCPVRDVEHLARCIEELIASPSASERLGRRGHELAAREYNVTQAILQLADLVGRRDPRPDREAAQPAAVQ